jgi:hypothetical protein
MLENQAIDEEAPDLVVGRDHVGDVTDGEGLSGQQAQGHRRAHAGVGAGEHHVLQSPDGRVRTFSLRPLGHGVR